MRVSKSVLLFTACFATLLMVAGCGGSSSSTAGKASPTVNQPTSVPPSAPFIQLAQATINGTKKTILTTAPGQTLYYYTADTATTIACTGQCATTWMPFMFAGTGTPIPPPSLPSNLSLVSTPKGNQLAYNGHPLYTYASDAAPGQTKGEGVGGKWFVATTDLKPNS
jgi:predicted lipoprotein with Yx(FWY)xxD motif